MSNVSTCLWFGEDPEPAVRFYVSLLPGSSLETILRSPGPWPGGQTGDVIMMTFTLGRPEFPGAERRRAGRIRNRRLHFGRVRRPGRGRSAVGSAHRGRRGGNHVRLAA